MSSPLDFLPTRAAALARLEEFLPDAGRYAADRNFVRPGHPNISRLSPWVQKRLLLEAEVVAAARERWSFEAVEKFVQEVYWRTYWKGWLEQRPEAWSRWVEAVPRLRDSLSAEQRSTLEAALAGRTGIAGFDDWAKELVATGYLHNHARMWFASIWVFTLRLPWELGAAFFYEQLLDGDVASNTLSWRWVAGLQTPGKTYVARADNIAHYTDGRHVPQASQLASAAFALSEPALPKVAAWTEDPLWSKSAEGRAGLWLHPEDLSVERGELSAEKFSRELDAMESDGYRIPAERRPRLINQRTQGPAPSRQIHCQRRPGEGSVDLVVLVNEEVPVGDRERPLDPGRGKNAAAREPLGGLAELHHQGVPRLLEETVCQVGALAAGDDLIGSRQPPVNVEQILCRAGLHQSTTASRRMSSSIGCRPP